MGFTGSWGCPCNSRVLDRDVDQVELVCGLSDDVGCGDEGVGDFDAWNFRHFEILNM